MSKYKVGDKVLVEGEIRGIQNSDCNEYPYRVLIAGLQRIHFSEDELRDASKTYEDGLADAWKLVKRILGLPREDWYNIFQIEDCFLIDILINFTYQEALAKLEAYEVSKQIEVGDVVYADDEPDSFGVVTWLEDDKYAYVLWDDGSSGFQEDISDIHKTGRTVDIEHLLKQIRGDE